MSVGNTYKRLLAIMMATFVMFAVIAVPEEAHAAGIKKAKYKYSVTVKNLKANTQINKGTKFKIKYKAVRKKGKSVKKVKVKFKSSNKKIATVSSKGVITAKKKGTVKITIYCKDRPNVRKIIKIKIVQPVTNITLSGDQYLTSNKASSFQAAVSPSDANNKNITWSSSNPAVAKVDSKGHVTAVGNGVATIYATAKDGSKVRGARNVFVHKYTAGETKWVAHRGLNTAALENSAKAFRLAGEAGFWGCECDVWETRHVIEDDNTESFDIVINHDSSYKRTHGVNKRVWDLSKDEVEAEIENACFFAEYLEICKAYGMVPVIEFKGTGDGLHDFSDEGVKRVVDLVEEVGGDDWLENAYYISFQKETLIKLQNEYLLRGLSVYPNTQYLIKGGDALSQIEDADIEGFTGVDIKYGLLTEEIADMCKTRNLLLGAWTYNNTTKSIETLYNHLVLKKYDIHMYTTDGALF